MMELNGHEWWSILATKLKADSTIYDLAVFLAKLHSVPANSAGLERGFSSYGLIWTKLRNNLSHQTAFKLVKCYRFLNSKAPVDQI